jgi:hypothetical protein
VNFPFLLLALPICIADLNLFVIPNIYTKLLFYVATFEVVLWGFGSIHQVIVSMVALSGLVVLGIGMGDIKLLALILITHLPCIRIYWHNLSNRSSSHSGIDRN